MAQPVNETQRLFDRLCQAGGGLRGGPAKAKVIELLRTSGRRLRTAGVAAMEEHLAAYPDANPWHLCFAVGLSWGHLATLDVEFTGAVTRLLANWNDDDLRSACSFHQERGPEPIERSLIGAYTLFNKVLLPSALPDSLEQLGRAQERWLSPILNPAGRPAYIGSWNATAMFMTALFARPALAETQRAAKPLLPPGGPIYAGLKMLHAAHIISRAPTGKDLDDQAFEPGAIYENNALLVELVSQAADWCMIDVHSGVYMLGTRHPHSASWE